MRELHIISCVAASTQESGTATEVEPFKSPPIEIHFKSSLTYAEKLMLKRARRTELGPAVRRTNTKRASHTHAHSRIVFLFCCSARIAQ